MTLISFTQIADGTLGTASQVNTPLSTIYNDYNGNITDANIAANAAIAGSKISNTSSVNIYKFRVSQNAAANTGNGAFAVVPFDTEQYDTNNNVSAGVYTVPISGYYQFNWKINATVSTGSPELLIASLFLNGTEISTGNRITGLNGQGSGGSDLYKLTAGNTLDIRVFCTTTRALNAGGTKECYFSGFLVSAT